MRICRLAEALEMDEGGAGAAEAGGALDSYYADDHYGDEKMRQVIVWTASQTLSVLRDWYNSALSAFITAAGAVKQTESGLPGGDLSRQHCCPQIRQCICPQGLFVQQLSVF